MQQQIAEQKNRRGIHYLADYVFFFLLFIIINLAVFYSGLYGYICNPDSYAGNVYTRLTILEQLEERSDTRAIALIGDSTTEEGLNARMLHEQTGLPVANLALPGTSPLEWHYFLRSIDPESNRFSSIVITITPQNMRSTAHEEGFQSLIPVAPPMLLVDYISHFPERLRSFGYYYAAFDRIYAFRWDLRNLIASPTRLANLQKTRKEYLEKIAAWPGRTFDVCEVKLNNGRVVEWGEIDDKDTRKLANNALNRMQKLNERPQVSGIYEPLENILDHYRRSGVPILIVSIPFGLHHDIPRKSRPVREYFRRLDEFDSLPNVAHWDATSLPLFKDCNSYYEFRHLNARGRDAFTLKLADRLRADSSEVARIRKQ